ncbi:MAG: recombination regulator RecX [Candidatus Omnitrophica bacterium]|nr:recombination regulator RecX [Candidatus Omnitrophota bacterium]
MDAKNYAFLLLKYRLRSENEIYQRLKKKNFPEAVIKKTISFLKEKGFIDDELFAKSWINSRLKKSLGLKRIRSELKLKGLDSGLIEESISKAKENYSQEQAAAEIAQKRVLKLKGIEPKKARQRLYAYLLRRGFSPDIIIDVMNNLWKQTS